MSLEEQDAMIARLVKDRSDAKKRHALLEHELTTAGKVLQEIGTSLQVLGTPSSIRGSLHGLVSLAATSLTGSKLAADLREYVELEKTIEDLNRRAKNAGIDL